MVGWFGGLTLECPCINVCSCGDCMIPETESGDMLTRELLRVVLEEDGNDETDISNPSKGSCRFLVVVCVRCCCCCFCLA